MAVAKLYPEPEKGGRGKKNSSEKEGFSVSAGKVSEARAVLRWLPEIAELVMAGTKPLDEAYQEAQRLKEQADAEPKRLERLRRRAPDLADLVDDGRMKLLEAESAYETRREETRRQRQAVLELFNGLERMLDVLASGKRRANVIEHLQQSDDKKRAQGLLRAWINNMSETLEEL
jgi:vacuolar-type H+-ATPase subunit I/STV1